VSTGTEGAEPPRLQTERSRFIIDDSKITIVVADTDCASEYATLHAPTHRRTHARRTQHNATKCARACSHTHTPARLAARTHTHTHTRTHQLLSLRVMRETPRGPCCASFFRTSPHCAKS
jgi:hypothetical protein